MTGDAAALSRPALVFATRRAPFPLDNGARIRSHRLLTGLAQVFDTTLFCLEHAPRSPDGATDAEELRRRLSGIAIVTAPGPDTRKRIGQVASLASWRSWSFGRYANTENMYGLATTVERSVPCVVHYDDLGVALFGAWPGAVNVYAAHNVEQRILRYGAETGSLVRRLYNAVEARKVEAEERRVWRAMDLCLAVSPVDAQAVSAGGARRVAVCPNGSDDVDACALLPRAHDAPVRIVFVGSGAYAPYERGLAWFVSKVLPRVRAEIAVRFDVVGQRPVRPIHAEGVSYLGPVPSVGPFYANAHVVVVPVFEGSGTRLKVVEAAVHGRPIVSTRLGAEGLPLTAGEHFFQASDAESFAAAILDVARRATLPGGDTELQGMVTRARLAVEPLLWPRIVSDLAARYMAELQRIT